LPGRNLQARYKFCPTISIVLPVIREVQRTGATTLRDIAAALNARGITTARGGKWYAMTVRNVLARA
jgi:hypothetical protein